MTIGITDPVKAYGSVPTNMAVATLGWLGGPTGGSHDGRREMLRYKEQGVVQPGSDRGV